MLKKGEFGDYAYEIMERMRIILCPFYDKIDESSEERFGAKERFYKLLKTRDELVGGIIDAREDGGSLRSKSRYI